LEDLQKNIFIIPSILARVNRAGVDFICDIYGDGPDSDELVERIRSAELGSYVKFYGAQRRDVLKQALKLYDLFLMPSRFEGCPQSLVEAMSSGVVPVVSNLSGIHDTMLLSGIEGYLCKLNDADEYSKRICELAADRGKLQQMSVAVRRRAVCDFDVSFAAKSYADLIMATDVKERAKPLLMGQIERLAFRAEHRWNWRRVIPKSLKKIVRTYMARMGRSV
jgi:glycosyltransferase involved in cell wall biosynthesis